MMPTGISQNGEKTPSQMSAAAKALAVLPSDAAAFLNVFPRDDFGPGGCRAASRKLLCFRPALPESIPVRRMLQSLALQDRNGGSMLHHFQPFLRFLLLFRLLRKRVKGFNGDCRIAKTRRERKRESRGLGGVGMIPAADGQ